MSQLTIDILEQHYDLIIQQVGTKSYVDWDSFTKATSQISKSIESLYSTLSIYKNAQQRNFIQTMKKLKVLDIPDLLQTVKMKKLPKQALRMILNRFNLENGKPILKESVQDLKNNAQNDFIIYMKDINLINEQINRSKQFLQNKIKQLGYDIKKQQQQQQNKIQSIKLKSTVQFNLPIQKIQSICQQIEIIQIPKTQNLISFKTYDQIVQRSFDLIKQPFQKLTINARLKQRQVMKNPEKYLEIMSQYIINNEVLIIKGQKIIAQKLGLKGNKLEESEIFMIERGLANNILISQSTLRTRVKQCMTSTKDVSLQLAKQIIHKQIVMINEQTEYLKLIFQGLQKNQQSIQMIPMLLALILNDLIYQHYGYEEQDFMKNISQKELQNNEELKQIFKEMQLSIIKLMRKLTFIPQQISNYMMQQAKKSSQLPERKINKNNKIIQSQQQKKQIIKQGIMPGSNTQNLLSIQQSQQMQQMLLHLKSEKQSEK